MAMGFLSNLFGKSEDRDLNKIFLQIKKMQDDERVQNQMLHPAVRSIIEAKKPSDVVPDGTGEFGYSNTNPIPVNGSIGEIAYLSKLRTHSGERLFFHRIGATIYGVGNAVDQFEAVTFSGSQWFILYFNMYFPKRSTKAPRGFTLSKEPSSFTGFHTRCENFPYDFIEKKSENTGQSLNLAYAPISLVQPYLESGNFVRPGNH